MYSLFVPSDGLTCVCVCACVRACVRACVCVLESFTTCVVYDLCVDYNFTACVANGLLKIYFTMNAVFAQVAERFLFCDCMHV